MMASSPVSGADDEVSRNGGTKRRYRNPNLRPADDAADAPLGSSDLQLQHMYQLLVDHLDELEEARNQRHEAWHAEMLAAIATLHDDIKALRAAMESGFRRLLRFFLGLH